jgi:hypothetical protein
VQSQFTLLTELPALVPRSGLVDMIQHQVGEGDIRSSDVREQHVPRPCGSLLRRELHDLSTSGMQPLAIRPKYWRIAMSCLDSVDNVV